MSERLSILYPFCQVRWSRVSITSELHVFFSSSKSNRNATDDKQSSHKKEQRNVCFFSTEQIGISLVLLSIGLRAKVCLSVPYMYAFVCLVLFCCVYVFFFHLNQVTWR